MLEILNNRKRRDPVCGAVAKKDFITKYGEKFCSGLCLEIFESQRENKKFKEGHFHNKDCGCCM